MIRQRVVLLTVLLVIISAVPRLIGLGSFTSLDEPFWLRQSANFYYALGQRDFANTIYEYHPAVTTMWVVTAGMLLYFPQYRALDEGYLKAGKFDLFLPAHGKDPLQLLIFSRTMQVIVVIVLLAAGFLLLRRLFDDFSAFLSVGLISLSPFFLGHSRLLNHEALLALFMLVAVLGMLVYLYRDRKLWLVLLSGAAGGLAQLTKSSGIVLLPVIVLMLLIHVLCGPRAGRQEAARRAAQTFGVWLLTLALAYVVFWPGMWVAPLQMLSDVYGNAFTYAFQGSRLSVTGGVNPDAFSLSSLIPGLQFYLSDVAWRTTPLTWLGLLLTLVLLVRDLRRGADLTFGLMALYAAVLAAEVILLFSVQRGPKPPHYAVTAYVCADLLAGLALARLIRLSGRPWLTWVLAAVVLGIQAASAAGSFPYYITYYDPLLETAQPGVQNPTLDNTGYGVGLDQAAAYLAQKAGAKDMTVLAANGYGCFSYYFPGHTTPINNFTLADPQVVQVLAGAQYVVVDYYNQKRINLVSDLQGLQPEHTIWINGIDFLRIYPASDFTGRAGSSAP